ncbi:DUF3624 domain-containing protein [Photobacterium sp. DNB23_23_1]|uniref:DUF3624 domain-containing protein n=1 Tax=Photobacterium pectinilyticum TaxID=2906793 RepID=A0ABT1MYR7_9GAMM|nr:DUF3624 domain-containing protein [Photobacterium sp. ZSDE20]MCQ1056789.1 DUF3624 domain-containing protein [Photobacterium sp. ZSDE20]MDD1820824.1 DUF3624 domain-containing protein [Photobacterium sp. ZSDE20]
MRCQACTNAVFWQKLGRCQRCTYQLSILSPLGWIVWAIFYRHQPTTLEAITLFVAATCMTLLLLAHGIRAWQLRGQVTHPGDTPKQNP